MEWSSLEYEQRRLNLLSEKARAPEQLEILQQAPGWFLSYFWDFITKRAIALPLPLCSFEYMCATCVSWGQQPSKNGQKHQKLQQLLASFISSYLLQYILGLYQPYETRGVPFFSRPYVFSWLSAKNNAGRVEGWRVKPARCKPKGADVAEMAFCIVSTSLDFGLYHNHLFVQYSRHDQHTFRKPWKEATIAAQNGPTKRLTPPPPHPPGERRMAYHKDTKKN